MARQQVSHQMNQCSTFAELLGYSYKVTQRHVVLGAQLWSRYVNGTNSLTAYWRSLINHIAGSCVPDCCRLSAQLPRSIQHWL
jgi:hypothetical protein